MEPFNSYSIIAELDKGVAGARISPLAEQLGLRVTDMSPLLSLSKRSSHRYCTSDSLDISTAEKIALLEILATHGVEVFDGNSGEFLRWLNCPLGVLTDKSPFQLLTSITGIQLVHGILLRIEYSIYG